MTQVTCVAGSSGGNKIILAIDYQMKWDYISISNNEEGS
jgi:hypothetical protein